MNKKKFKKTKQVPGEKVKIQNLAHALRNVSVKLERISSPKNMQSIKVNGSVASANADEVQKWHEKICDHLRNANHLDVLENGDRIFNMSEIHFPLTSTFPASSSVPPLSPIDASGLEVPFPSVTTMVTINASGLMGLVFLPLNALPPKNIFDEEDSGVISESTINSTANDNLFTYMQDVFHPWLIAESVHFPVLVFFDIDPKFVSWAVSNFCKINQIILLSMSPAQRMHPMKSIVLPRLTNAWNTELLDWNHKNGMRQCPNDLIPEILRQVFERTITVDLLKSGFRECGMFPFCPVAASAEGMTTSTSKSELDGTPDHTIHSTPQLSTPQLTKQTTESLQSSPQLTFRGFNSVAASNEIILISKSQQTFKTVSEQQTTERASPTAPQHSIQQTPDLLESTPQPVLQKIDLEQLPRSQFEELLGPLLHELKNSENVWKGAVENTSLFEVWQRLLQSSQQSTNQPSQSTDEPTLEEIDPKQLLRLQFLDLLGPLIHEFNSSGNVWLGAIENTGLFEVWQRLITSQDSSAQMTHQEIKPKQLFRMQYEEYLGPLRHEFKKSGNIWMGASENIAWFEVWKSLEASGER